MTDLEKIEENDLLDFDDLFADFVPDDICFLDGGHELSSDGRTPNSLPSDNAAASLSIGDIEDLLLNDDFETLAPEENYAFLSGLLVDSPSPPTLDATSDSSAASVSHSPLVECNNSKDCSNSNSVEKDQNVHPPQNEDNVHINDDAVDDNDTDSKKRKRQLRNRDAAVRSRERKKMYVKDLEMKSRYYEAECRRLEWVLQCLRAENHALQFSLHNRQAFGTSTKQESAVLLLESLLLGSLLWLMGIIGLFILPRQLQKAALLESAEEKCQRSLAPRKIVNDMFGMSVLQSFMKSKRWRGSRTRMKVFLARSCKCLMSSTSSSYEGSSINESFEAVYCEFDFLGCYNHVLSPL